MLFNFYTIRTLSIDKMTKPFGLSTTPLLPGAALLFLYQKKP